MEQRRDDAKDDRGIPHRVVAAGRVERDTAQPGAEERADLVAEKDEPEQHTEMLGQFYKLVTFDELEDFDAAGIRIVSYVAPLLGSKLCLGRIYDIDNVAVIAS